MIWGRHHHVGPLSQHHRRHPRRRSRRRHCPGYAWDPGHWIWDGAQYVWEVGKYIVQPTNGATFIPGYWQEYSGGWAWVEGRWSWGTQGKASRARYLNARAEAGFKVGLVKPIDRRARNALELIGTAVPAFVTVMIDVRTVSWDWSGMICRRDRRH
jgi:hypothetical protein